MKYTQKELADLHSLNVYIRNNFIKFNISIDVDYVKLLNVTNYRFNINKKSYVCETEKDAWLFMDGMYVALEETKG